MMSKSKRSVSSWSELFYDKTVIFSGFFFLGALSLSFSPSYYAQILDALHRALPVCTFKMLLWFHLWFL